jgi:DNA-binding transcriptional MocR family regulator
MRSSHDVAADIRRKIDSGEWADGFRVPPERELAATYRLARNTVRRALQELDGSLVRVVGRGTFVKGNAGARPREFLGRLRDASPTDIMEVRLIMEPQAAALAAHRRTRRPRRARGDPAQEHYGEGHGRVRALGRGAPPRDLPRHQERAAHRLLRGHQRRTQPAALVPPEAEEHDGDAAPPI